MEAADPTKVQHVTKKSSDELLRKFAEVGSDSGDETTSVKKELRLSKRRKRSKNLREIEFCNHGESPQKNNNVGGGGSSLVERKRLLPPAAARRSSVLLRQLGIGRSQLRNKSLMRTIGRTWRKTVEGASRVLMEKHYNRHRRLINDAV